MDLRAPLPGGNSNAGPSNKDNDQSTSPWVVSSSSSSSNVQSPTSFNPRLYERIIYHLLCRMYAASQAMELGSESTFTGQILFHRHVRQFYHLVAHKKHPQKHQSQEVMQIKKYLGSVAAACLFLGCKMEEEPRRIRDVINLSHVLNFSSWDDDTDAASISNSTADPLTEAPGGEQKQRYKQNSTEGNTNTPIIIVEANHPPLLDESYWSAKEQMVSTEQHVLRMISFDTTVCHPHRCVLIIMETLGFGVGKSNNDNNNNNNQWLLSCDKSQNLISRSWRVLNEAVLDPRGVALQYPVIALSCAAISLAADGVGASYCLQHHGDKQNDSGNIALPEYWWRALDVSTKDITSLQKVLQI